MTTLYRLRARVTLLRWLARYEKESEQEILDQRPRRPGAFARMSMDCSIYLGMFGNGL